MSEHFSPEQKQYREGFTAGLQIARHAIEALTGMMAPEAVA